MRVIVCLAVFLVASLSTGEALKCRMCTSEKDTDLCTKNPWIIGVQECGKPGMDIGKTLEEIKPKLGNESSMPTSNDLKELADTMKTLVYKKTMLGDYIESSNETMKDLKIKEVIKAYDTFIRTESAKDNPDMESNNIKKLQIFSNNETLEVMLTKFNLANAKISGVEHINKNNYASDTAWPSFKSKLDLIKAAITNLNVTEITTLENDLKSRKEAILNKTTELTTLSYLSQTVVTAVKETVNNMDETKIADLKTAVQNYSPTDPTAGKATTQELVSGKGHLNAYFDHVTKMSKIIISLTTLEHHFEAIISFMDAENNKITAKLKEDLAKLRAATTESIAQLSTPAANTTWVCFKAIKDEKIVTKRGCTAKVEEKKGELLICDQDGCNSSSISTIAALPIFLAIAVALGFAR